MEADIIAKELESPFSVLTSDRFSLSALKLLVCDGGCGRGICFSKACAQVDYIYHSTPTGRAKPKIHAFTEIFPTGSAVLMEFIVSRTRTDPALNTLLSFIPQIEGIMEIIELLHINLHHSQGHLGLCEFAAYLDLSCLVYCIAPIFFLAHLS